MYGWRPDKVLLMARRLNKNTRRLTFCAACVALGVVILLLGSFIEVLDLTAGAFAGMIAVLVVIELGGKWAWPTFAATALLGLLLLPAKLPVVFYILLGGWYPIVKEQIEKIKVKPLGWLIKIVLLNVAFALAMIVSKYVLMLPGDTLWMTAVLALAMNVAFILFDIALTRIISLYIFKLRARLRIDRFFR